MIPDLPHHRHGGFDWNRIGLDECGSHPGEQLEMDLPGGGKVTLRRRVAELRHRLWCRVRDDRYHSIAACGHDGERHLVIAGQHGEMRWPILQNVGDLSEI